MQRTILRKMPEAHGREVVQGARIPRVPNRAGGGLARALSTRYELKVLTAFKLNR